MSTSYWLDRSRLPENPEFGSQIKVYDVVIIGGGIAGFSTAYWLKKEDPSLKVAVLEKHRLGFGATGRNAGFITCGSVEHFNRLQHKYGEKGALEIWKFSEKNLELMKEHVIRDKASQIDFEQTGTFSLATSEPEIKELSECANLMSSLGIRVEKLDQTATEKRVGVTGFLGGIKYLDDATVNPIKLLNLLRSRCDIDFFEQTEVYGIGAKSDTRIVRTDRFTFESSMVIACLNGYSASLFPYFRDKIFPTRGQILVTEPVPRFMEGACYANFYLDYFRQLCTGEILIGGFRQIEKATEVGYSDHTTDLIQESLQIFIDNHIPKLKGKKIINRWGGVMGFSVDGQPLVGSMPDDPQVMFNGGFTGHGIGLAFHTSKCVVDAMFGRDIPSFISAKRF